MSSERLNPSHERRNTHLKEDWKLKRENDNNSSGYGSDVSLIEAADIKEGNHADSVAVNQQGSIDRKQSEASNESTKNSPDSTILPCNEDTHTTNDLDSDGVYNIVPVSASETAEITSDEQCGLHHTCNDEYSIRYSEKRRDSNQEDNDDYTENDFKAFLTCTDNTKEADSGIDTNKEQADDSLDVSRATDSGTDVSGQARSDTDINRQVSSDTDVSRQAGNDTDINRHASSDTDVGRQAGSDTDINRHASSDTDVSRQAGSDTDINRHASSDTDVSRQARSDTDFSTQARSDMDVSRQAHSDRDVSRNDVCDMVANRDVEHIKDREEDTDSIADGDNYHVQHKEMEELEIQETNRPCLYSQKSTISTTSCQQNKVKVEKTHSDVVDSSKAERSERQRYKIEKRKTKVLKIDGETDFCKIQTVKYRYKEKVSRQHYMKRLKDDKMEVDGDIGLRPGDLFLKLNGTPLQDKKQKKVRKMFKNIKPGTDGNIQMELVFQRWETRHHDGEDRVFEVVYKLKLILEPETSDRSSSHSSIEPVENTTKNFVFKVAQSIKEQTGQVQLNKGEIDQIKPRNSETRLIKALYVGVDEYVTVLDDGLPGLEVPTESNQSQNHFTLQFFSGMDKSSEPLSQFIYCVRFGYQGRLGTCYLTTELPSHNELAFRESTTTRVTQPDDVDETCFIMRAIGSEMLFESLLYRGYYISCETTSEESQCFVMLHKTKAEVIDDKDLDSLKFELCRPSQTLEQTTGLQKILRLFTSCSSRRSESYTFR